MPTRVLDILLTVLEHFPAVLDYFPGVSSPHLSKGFVGCRALTYVRATDRRATDVRATDDQ